jgi:opacity protein-like surface antigen
MRKASTIGLVGLTLVALAGTVRAEEATAPPVATTSAASPAPVRRLEVGVAFLPMSLGKFTASYGGMRIPADAAFAPGVSISVGYRIFRYLSVGLAPQAIFNVGTKEDPTGAGLPVVMSTEYDLMARLVGLLPLVETITIYGELLPGYSLIKPSEGNTAKGFVLAGGVGVAMDLSDAMFLNLGVGYQQGYQTRTDTAVIEGETTKVTTDVQTEYWRVALGVGMRF